VVGREVEDGVDVAGRLVGELPVFEVATDDFDLVFDAVGKSSFGKCKPLLKKRGISTSTELGRGSQNPFLALITPLFGGKKVLFPIPSIKKEDLLFLKERVEKGEFRPLIDRSYPMEEVVEAYRYVETGQKTGNVLLRIGKSQGTASKTPEEHADLPLEPVHSG
jgi:NADPH:quinone reductase-like Zn-dependent oxidoreductase